MELEFAVEPAKRGMREKGEDRHSENSTRLFVPTGWLLQAADQMYT